MNLGRAKTGIMHLIIMAVCMWTVPEYMLKSHMVWGLIVGFCIASALIFLTKGIWKPWVSEGENVNLPS